MLPTRELIPELPFTDPLPSPGAPSAKSFAKHVAAFREFGQPTRELITRYSTSDGTNFTTYTFAQDLSYGLNAISQAFARPPIPSKYSSDDTSSSGWGGGGSAGGGFSGFDGGGSSGGGFGGGGVSSW